MRKAHLEYVPNSVELEDIAFDHVSKVTEPVMETGIGCGFPVASAEFLPIGQGLGKGAGVRLLAVTLNWAAWVSHAHPRALTKALLDSALYLYPDWAGLVIMEGAQLR